MKKQQGFTLIELIMVIVILGILSAFALPRFADLSGNAETASVEGALASARSTSAIMHAASLAENTTALDQGDANAVVDLEGSNHQLRFGYPAVSGVAADLDILEAANISTSDYTIEYTDGTDVANATAAATRVHVTTPSASDGDTCFYYEEATAANDSPAFSTGTWDVDGTAPDNRCEP